MIKCVDICQRTKQYRLPRCFTWESYEGSTLNELRNNLINKLNEYHKWLIERKPETKLDDIIFVEVENDYSGIIV